MADKILNRVAKKSNPQTVGQAIKKREAMGKATSENPELVIAIANAGKVAATENQITDEVVKRIIDSDTELKLAAQDNDFRKELADLLKDVNDDVVIVDVPGKKFPGFVPGGKTGGGTGSAPGGSTGEAKPSVPEAAAESEENVVVIKPSSELYQRLLAIIAQIPDARPGMIITDEHHNTLKEAVRTITALLADSEEPEKFVITFPPYFMPAIPDEEEERISADWLVTFNKAIVPTEKVRETPIEKVRGAVMVQLPEGARILKVIVRGRRFENKTAPEICSVHFLRLPHESEEKLREKANFTLPDPVAVFDLKREKDFFELTAKPDAKAATVDNVKFQYVISAIWEGKKETDRYEIYGIQAICER